MFIDPRGAACGQGDEIAPLRWVYCDLEVGYMVIEGLRIS